jgi:hypothetical protein
MLEEMNDWGYSIRRRPFIFTEKTLKIKEEEEAMANREILSFSSSFPIKWTRASMPKTFESSLLTI